ncbi:MAG: nitrate reductase cytochrome c-type subunit [Ectothiorhodospiraceae bacterium]|nr:nitrate reductase cytochrome c-type subunit [Ectothiorhodospiraceae bacterium]
MRGAIAIPDANAASPVMKQNTDRTQLGRAYRQQPPLIPHNIEKYQISLKVNQCMACHDWPNNVREGAPKISETHYIDRDGVALDHVARTRWFCNQCHVPQVAAQPLVENQFKSATEVK